MPITNISRDWGVNPSIVRVITTDNLATITAANYLGTQVDEILSLNRGAFEWADRDLVAIAYSGGEDYFTRDAANNTFIVDVVPVGAIPLVSAHILVGNAANLATDVAVTGIMAISNAGVTSIPLASAQILVGNGANLAAGVAVTGDVTISNAGVTTLAANTIKYAQVAVTAAEFNGMYAAPKLLIAAPGAGLIIQVDNIWYDMAFVAAQYAAGGVVNAQYDSTVNGAGVVVTNDVAAATVQGLAASSILRPGLAVAAMAQATTVNKGLYLSNKTAAFTTGDGTWKVNIAYRIITA